VLCAAFALGNASSNICPASNYRLDTAVLCKSAAGIGGMMYGETGAYSYYPAGCFWHTITGSVYFNTNADGAANYYAKPLCAGVLCGRMPARCLYARTM
jgi:hypothetical protein